MTLPKTFLLIAITVATITSCSNTENNKKVVGKWAAVQWLADGKPTNYDISNTGFSFDTTGHYTFVYGTKVENGTYKVENDQLFTTPANEREMMVKISKATPDSLVFVMNRGGQDEELTLVKEKK